MNKRDTREGVQTPTDEIETSRRRFLKKAGKLAVYTPPAMALMMQPSEASFLRSGAVTSIKDRLDEHYGDEWPDDIQRFFDWIKSWYNSGN